jgi:hypothetical protein
MPLSWGFGLSAAQPGRRAAAQGGAQRILRSCWAGEGLWAYQEAKYAKTSPYVRSWAQREPVEAPGAAIERGAGMKWVGRNGRLQGALRGMSFGGLG